jgi:hypothetical protein
MLLRKEVLNRRTLGTSEGLPRRQRHATVYGIPVLTTNVTNLAASVGESILRISRRNSRKRPPCRLSRTDHPSMSAMAEMRELKREYSAIILLQREDENS